MIRGLRFTKFKGGPSSGNIGHSGRAGVHGESDAGGGSWLRGAWSSGRAEKLGAELEKEYEGFARAVKGHIGGTKLTPEAVTWGVKSQLKGKVSVEEARILAKQQLAKATTLAQWDLKNRYGESFTLYHGTESKYGVGDIPKLAGRDWSAGTSLTIDLETAKFFAGKNGTVLKIQAKPSDILWHAKISPALQSGYLWFGSEHEFIFKGGKLEIVGTASPAAKVFKAARLAAQKEFYLQVLTRGFIQLGLKKNEAKTLAWVYLPVMVKILAKK